MIFRLILSLLIPGLIFSCAGLVPPKEYIPDEKLVYLTQSRTLTPIVYAPAPADPYSFAPTLDEPTGEDAFARTTWAGLLDLDYQSDVKTYRTVSRQFESLLTSREIQSLRTVLDKAQVAVTPPLAPKTGAKKQDYTNGGEFDYPDAPQAVITVLNDGYYEILFADKSRFRYQKDGTYEMTGPTGKTVFANYTQNHQYVTTTAEGTFRIDPHFREVTTALGSLSFSDEGDPQYHYTPASAAGSYSCTIFTDGKDQILSVMVTKTEGMRIDYFPREEGDQKPGLLFTKGTEAVSLGPDFQKVIQFFDVHKRKTAGLLSVYLPEGIHLANLGSQDPAYSEVIPAWPEHYLTRNAGSFDILYTAKDEALVRQLDPARMAQIEANDRRLTGLSTLKRKTIVVPPDLDSYRRLHSGRPNDVLNWYPSGFETKDIIMWPVSVPRYKEPAGLKYYLTEEFYEILTHEYVHVLVGENSGIFSPLPIWLNEGLAVYVEGEFSKEVKTYWDAVFSFSARTGKLLDWDLVTEKTTGEFDVVRARIHYAQSYAMVKFLVEKYGSARVAQYIRSFRLPPTENRETDLKKTYKENFKKIFGIDFESAVKGLAKT